MLVSEMINNIFYFTIFGAYHPGNPLYHSGRGAKKTIYLIYSFEFIITYIYLAILENYSENSDNLSNLFF